MTYQPPALKKLVSELKRLPGIGQKSAQRIAAYLLRAPTEEVLRLAESIREAKERIRFCSTCWGLAEDDPCEICKDPQRDRSLVCVVEDPNAVLLLEQGRTFNGLYHVLHGSLAPLDGIGPDQLKIRELLTRLRSGEVREVIVATNPNVEGEATAMYLSKLIKPLGVAVTQIARGVPVGSDLEFADEVTLAKALEGRRTLE